MKEQIIECVPNFSEGIDKGIIDKIAHAIQQVGSVQLLNVDMGYDANRTVITFAGTPNAVVDAAFAAIKIAGELIDMRVQKGEHPRMGATDVCPLIPIQNITMEETNKYAQELAKRVGAELGIPVYLYEYSQPDKKRNNLAAIRSGEYEGFFEKMVLPEWQPDYGPASMDAKRGATVIGARKYLVAYNVTLNTLSVNIANAIAQKVRESGAKGQPGLLKNVKAIGWYMAEYQAAQVSMNLTDIDVTPVHRAFAEVCRIAHQYGVSVTGSELIGLIPLQALLQAGRFSYEQSGQSSLLSVSENDLIAEAVRYLMLDEKDDFDASKRIIERVLLLPK